MNKLRSVVFGLVAVLALAALLFPPPNKRATVLNLDAVPTVEAMDVDFCNALHPVCVSVGDIFYAGCRAEGGWWWTCSNESSLRTAECMRIAGCTLNN